MCLWGYTDIELDDPPPTKAEPERNYVLVDERLNLQPITHPQAVYYQPVQQAQYFQPVPMAPGLANIGGPDAHRAALQALGYPPNLQLVPEIATVNTRYVVKHRGTPVTTSEHTLNEIMADYQPGHWEHSRIGMPYWIQH